MNNLVGKYEFKYVPSNIDNLNQYLKLYQECFKKYNKNLDYLDWLYSKSPDGLFLGIDVYYKEYLIGQVCGIRSLFNYLGSLKKVIYPLNVCVKKEFRKKNIFYNAIQKFEILCNENDIDFIIGTGNAQATPGWIKQNYKYLKSLDVFIFSESFNLEKIKFNNDIFYSVWSEDRINWRISNPINKISLYNKETRLISVASTHIPFLNIVSTFGNSKQTQLPNLSKNKLNIFIGMIPDTNKKFISLPNFLKKSPLNLIYKNLKNEKYILEKDSCFFSFLDFDHF